MLELRHWAPNAVRNIEADTHSIPLTFAVASLLAAVAAYAQQGGALATGVLQHGF